MRGSIAARSQATGRSAYRQIPIALSLLAVALALLALAPASQAKVVVDAFGFPGPEGGHLNIPTGIAINQTGAGGVAPGTLYVGEYNEGSAAGKDANRIQRLDPEGNFERLWGFDVVQGSGTGFEICTVASQCKLGIDTPTTANGGQLSSPSAIAVDQSTGNVYVSDSGNRRIEEFDANGNFIRAWGWDVVSSGGAGDVSENAFEICTVAADCKRGAKSSSGGSIAGTLGMVFDSSNHVWFGDPENHRFEEFEPNGSFIAAYGWDVDALGGSGGLEKCTNTAPGACQAGTEGTALGQFGFSGPRAITIDSSGFIYAGDFRFNDTEAANNRFQRFDPGVTSASLFAPDFFAETGLSSFQDSKILALPGGNFLFSASATGGVRLFELDESGQVLETSLAGDGLRQVSYLARNDTTGTIYATVNNSNNSPGVVVIDDGPPQVPPTAAIDPVTAVGFEGATLNATADPLGLPVAKCKFQYSTDQVTWEDVPEPDCASLDVDGGPQPLSPTVDGLEPETHYYVRFSAGRYYADASALSGEVGFTTPAGLPVLSDVGAAQITDTSAYLAGEIKPRSQSSEYHFEYGSTPALGTSTSTIGLTGSKQTVVSDLLEGLQPETNYYLRLVVTNAAGTTESEPTSSFRTRPTAPPEPESCPNDALRAQQGSTYLPECRAYEQVSPLDKNFANADLGSENSAVAADGEAVAFCGSTGFGEPPGQILFVCTDYRAARTPSGWRTRWVGEPFCVASLDTDQRFTLRSNYPAFSANLDLAAFLRPEESASCPFPSLDPAAPMPQINLYRADYRSDPISYDLLPPKPGFRGLTFNELSGQYEAASEDWSHVVYTSTGKQTANAPAGNFHKVFDWHEGALSLVSVNPAGKPFTTSSAVPDDDLHSVSADGSRIFFMSPGDQNSSTCASSTCEIYMRQSATETFDVSQSECTSSCGESAADEFLAATASGAKALFISEAKLTDGDTAANGADLYLYTHTSNPPVDKNLTLLSPDSEPADGSGAKVLGLLGISDDGETVYFVANGQLLAGAPTAAGPKVYRWQANGASPTLTYLATLAPPATGSDASNWSGSGQGDKRGDSREVTPDGKYLLIHTFTRLDRGADHDSDVDVYRFSQADGWICLSCQAPAAPSAGDSTFFARGGRYRNVISEDGARVFFTSSDPLLPADTNERRDLYEWHEDGALTLISTGTDSTDVKFLGASTSGDDVFFTTFQRLVGWDTDNNVDVYDARLGGGFPEPPPPTGAPCEGEACRGAPSSTPAATGCGTCVFEAPVTKPPKPCPKGKVRRHGNCVKKHSKKHHKRHRAANHNRRARR